MKVNGPESRRAAETSEANAINSKPISVAPSLQYSAGTKDPIYLAKGARGALDTAGKPSRNRKAHRFDRKSSRRSSGPHV